VFRKNTVAIVGPVEITPDAMLTWFDVNVENPEPDPSDQRTGALRLTEELLDPTESTHARVALTLSERPWADAFAVPAVIAGAADVATAATCTFTRGGTVTVTMWVRLLEDPRCAMAARDIIALPTTSTRSVRRNQTILQSLQSP
jgi:hypothetical protein